jgi:cytochrome c biogenesis protein CcmG, thiol:disulfide interchange protein DsbE
VSNNPNRKPGRRPAERARAAQNPNRWVVWAALGVIALVAVIAVIVVASSGGGNDEVSTGPAAEFETAPGLTVDGTSLPAFEAGTRDTAVGMTAPTLESVDFAGKPATAGGATGSPYALVFLAHWCPHCQAEVPRLVDLAQGGRIAGVDVIGIPTGTTDQAPNYPPSEWLAREDWPFPDLLDTANRKAAAAYGLTSYPFFTFVDAQGKVVGRTSGEVASDDLEAIFSALAKGQTPPLPGAGASSGTR